MDRGGGWVIWWKSTLKEVFFLGDFFFLSVGVEGGIWYMKVSVVVMIVGIIGIRWGRDSFI